MSRVLRAMSSAIKIPTRPMGKNGPAVPRIGMGLMGVSAIYGLPAPTADRLALLDRAYELGDTFWDTGMWNAARLPAPFK